MRNPGYTSSQDIVKANGSTFYNSSKELVDKIAKLFRDYCRPNELYEQGIKAEILEPGKKWVKGKIRLRLVMEFIPDEPEENNKTGQFGSTLDDIRNLKL